MSNTPNELTDGDDDHKATSSTPLLKPHSGHVENTGDLAGAQQAQSTQDRWHSAHNRRNPRNWTWWYKWMTVILVSFIEFLTTMPNFMYAPNILDAQKDLDTTNTTLATFSLTIYILGFGLGPLLFAPLSEMYGRLVIYRSCMSVFLLMTVACALSSNINMLVAFRFLAGSFGAAPVAIGGAVVGDLFPTHERGTAMSIYQAGQIISAVVGPPIGGLIGSYMNWRWVFWIVCIMSAFALLCTMTVLQETHAQTVMRRESVPVSSAEDGAKPEDSHGLVTELKRTLSRPLKLLFQSPVIAASCLLIFLVIGILNVFLTLMSRVYQQVYGMSSGRSSLAYLGLALGFVAASALFGATNDRTIQLLTRKHHGQARPEFRLPATIVAMPIVVIGLLWYGWTLQFKIHWMAPTVGAGIAGLGITTVQLSVTTYVIDSFDDISASALAAVTMARSVGGAVLPLIGPMLYENTGLGWGNTILAFVNMVACVIPVLLYMFGPRWRASISTQDM